MTLFAKWQTLIQNQTDNTFKKFWEEYSSTEENIYNQILDKPKTKVKDTFKNLYEKYNADPVIFMGFLDGINTSLKKELDLESIDEASEIKLDIIFDKLYFNMLDAKADHLYVLPQWKDILGEEDMERIKKEYKKSKTIVKEKEPGRNDPCPCGSGKKHKKCCGAN